VNPLRKIFSTRDQSDSVIYGRALKIKKMAQMQGKDIYFGDAAHVRSDHHAKKGKPRLSYRPAAATE
jgi:hypothetical protein